MSKDCKKIEMTTLTISSTSFLFNFMFSLPNANDLIKIILIFLYGKLIGILSSQYIRHLSWGKSIRFKKFPKSTKVPNSLNATILISIIFCI